MIGNTPEEVAHIAEEFRGALQAVMAAEVAEARRELAGIRAEMTRLEREFWQELLDECKLIKEQLQADIAAMRELTNRPVVHVHDSWAQDEVIR
jgi:hypothetical protein